MLGLDDLLSPVLVQQGGLTALAQSARDELRTRFRQRALRDPPIPIADQFELYTRLTGLRNRVRYDAETEPWSFIHVDPAEVDHYTTGLELPWGLGRVQDGDWDRDRHCDHIRENAKYRGLVERFEEGHDWADTEYYDDVKSRFEAGENPRGFANFETFENERLPAVDDLYESIAAHGWRPNHERDHEPADWTAYASSLDPLVAIGREGDVLWYEGYTRFMLADVLGVAEIPVLVLCRHSEWQATRDAVATGQSLDRRQVANHPDLRILRTSKP
ncbi:hypothetical protein [Haloarchaeobius sp. DFWS5]|uniref:hypothetical protein n=1 Tax=Haloarchaeobius sp. DFWS5 TaxID=3446114 RepID=UPI003EB6AEB7